MIMSFSRHISLFFCLMVLIVVHITTCAMQSSGSSELVEISYNDRSTWGTTKITSSHPIHRKLLFIGECHGRRDVRISQSLVSTHGIPTFVVEVMNTCTAECALREIHLHCGDFVSARLNDPLALKKLSYDDCLVNEGKPLEAGQIVSFAYYNTFKYHLAFKSAKFCYEA